jgi:DNA mismatch repair protein MutL
VAVELVAGPLRITGRAGIPDAARSRADWQFAYVNGRYVRDKVITHGARSAYEDLLHGQRQPVYALYVEIAPSGSTSTCTRPRSRCASATAARCTRRCGGRWRGAVGAAGGSGRRAGAGGTAAAGAAGIPGVAAAVDAVGECGFGCRGTWSRTPDPEPAPGGVAARTHPAIPAGVAAPPPPLPEGDWPLGRAVLQLQGIYILAENTQGLVIVDMHAAHERIVYERLKTQMDAQAIRSQPLLIPATFSATPAEVATAEACEATLEALGLQVTPFSPKTLGGARGAGGAG